MSFFLGELFGCDLLIDTSDPEIAGKARAHLEALDKQSKILADIQTEIEARRF